jgi:hypothetical protein
MSQLDDILRRLRAAIAIVVMWALMFGVSAAGAAAADANDAVLKNNDSGSVGLFACFKRHMTQRGDAAGEKSDQKHDAAKHRCPCCLAAHWAAAAVLPARLGAAAPLPPVPVRVAPFAATTHRPPGVAFHYANGARAPPAA